MDQGVRPSGTFLIVTSHLSETAPELTGGAHFVLGGGPTHRGIGGLQADDLRRLRGLPVDGSPHSVSLRDQRTEG